MQLSREAGGDSSRRREGTSVTRTSAGVREGSPGKHLPSSGEGVYRASEQR